MTSLAALKRSIKAQETSAARAAWAAIGALRGARVPLVRPLHQALYAAHRTIGGLAALEVVDVPEGGEVGGAVPGDRDRPPLPRERRLRVVAGPLLEAGGARPLHHHREAGRGERLRRRSGGRRQRRRGPDAGEAESGGEEDRSFHGAAFKGAGLNLALLAGRGPYSIRFRGFSRDSNVIPDLIRDP